MSEPREQYVIAGEDPEEVLNIGAVHFVRARDGQVRIEINVARMRHTQRLTVAEEKELIEFLLLDRKETTLLITLSDGEGEEEGEELQGAPATFLEIRE